MNKDKHAVLILAHNDLYLLEKLIKSLDGEYFDIFIHIDRKQKKIDYEKLKSLVTKSKIYFVPNLKVYWGGYSIVKAELTLFKEAFKRGYAFYHLISGSDLALKTPKEIVEYINRNRYITYIEVKTKINLDNKVLFDRFGLYHFFSNKVQSSNFINFIDRVLLKIQRILKISHYDHRVQYFYGSEWASLSHESVEILIKSEDWIKKYFRFSRAADEIYKQTVLSNPIIWPDEYKNMKIGISENGNKRFILWTGEVPHPMTLTIKQIDDLFRSECFFARKFSSLVDKEVITELYNKVVYGSKT